MDAEKPSRRRSHERHVLLIVVIIAGLGLGYVGWQASIVRHRRAMREQIKAGGAFVLANFTDFNGESPPGRIQIRFADADHQISKIRELLGDEPILGIEFPRLFTAADREAAEAFPEAIILATPGSPPATP